MRDDHAFLPIFCAAALVLAIAMQLAQTGNTEMPQESQSYGRQRTPMPTIAGQFVPPIIQTQPIFSPTRTGNINAEQAIQAPLGGAILAGIVSIKGRSYAVVQRPDGGITRLAVGGRYAGWRLQSLSSSGGVFGQGKERISMTFGMAPPATQQSENEEE